MKENNKSLDKKPLNIKLAMNLANPRSWVASAYPAIFGILFCILRGYSLSPWKCVFLLLACILLQSAVNTLNDYMDFIKGTDNLSDHVEESDAVLLYSGIAPKSALYLGLGFLMAGIVFGLVSCVGHTIYPVLIGLVGVAVVALYSCGPVPISYLPIGELISGGVMGGLIPLGICACADGKLHMDVLIASMPFIIGIGMIMLCNNGCDIEKDTSAGRHTFPTVVGRKNTLLVYHTFILLWLMLLVVEPIVLLGKTGILCSIFTILLGRKAFWNLMHLQLKPETRIIQMQTIVAANFTGNGAYCLTFLAACLMRIFHG